VRPSGLLTQSERRLCVLLLLVAAAAALERGRERLDPATRAWLEALPAGEEAGEPPLPPVAGPEPPPPGVDPNTAGAEELRTLPGIGPALAARILEDRRARGPYTRPEDLLRVRGIGPATLARLRPRLELAPAPSDTPGTAGPGGG
jgi:competence protein ComEA